MPDGQYLSCCPSRGRLAAQAGSLPARIARTPRSTSLACRAVYPAPRSVSDACVRAREARGTASENCSFTPCASCRARARRS